MLMQETFLKKSVDEIRTRAQNYQFRYNDLALEDLRMLLQGCIKYYPGNSLQHSRIRLIITKKEGKIQEEAGNLKSKRKISAEMMPAKKLKQNPKKRERKSFFSGLTASLAPSSWFKTTEKAKNSHECPEISEEEEKILPSKQQKIDSLTKKNN